MGYCRGVYARHDKMGTWISEQGYISRDTYRLKVDQGRVNEALGMDVDFVNDIAVMGTEFMVSYFQWETPGVLSSKLSMKDTTAL